MTDRRRSWFVVVVGAAVVLTVAYAALRHRAASASSAPRSRIDVAALAPLLARPHVLFRNTRQDEFYGMVMVAPLDGQSPVRLPTGLVCERVDVAGGTGVCLSAARGVRTTYSAVVFNERFEHVHTVPLTGIPSRVRVSPDGRLAGITVFVSGHAYSESAFSTTTTLLDTRTGASLADLESFEVTKEGLPFKHVDFNFWGVTFAADSVTFYATVSSGGVYYLVKANAATRKAVVIGDGVECPSLSPDNARIAFKKREIDSGRMVWRLAVLDLSSGRQQVDTGETRSVDDQVEWQDSRHVLYSLPDPRKAGSMEVWSSALDGTPPVRVLQDAYSPSVSSPAD